MKQPKKWSKTGVRRLETKVIKTVVNMSFWFWNSKKILKKFRGQYIKHIDSIDTKWSIFNPLKIKATVIVVSQSDEEFNEMLKKNSPRKGIV